MTRPSGLPVRLVSSIGDRRPATIGEGGWSYSSTSLCEAATLAGGRLYRVQMEHWADTETPGKPGGMVEVLAKMVS
jgi:hypothetical protein